MTLDHCNISGNTAARFIGGIDNLGRLTVANTTIANNVASFAGGLDNLSGWVEMSNSTVTGNSGGAIANSGSMMITGSTIAGNTSGGAFGGIFHSGSFDLNITNSTISNNTAGTGAAGIFVSAPDPGMLPTVELTSTTITRNIGRGPAAVGGMIVLRSQDGRTPRVSVRNTIIAENESVGGRPDVFGPVFSLGYNLIGQADTSTGWLDTDQTGSAGQALNPRLGPLGEYGGPTPTHALLADSPAIAQGDRALAYTLDQRGTLREVPARGRPDIGAFEAAPPFRFQVLAPSQVTSGEPFNLTVIALDRAGNTASTYTRSIHFISTDPGASLPDDYTFSTDDLGQQVFSITLQAPGRQTVTVVDLDNRVFPGAVTVDVLESSAPSRGQAFFWALIFWESDSNGGHPRRV
jgi:hypothetical protein